MMKSLYSGVSGLKIHNQRMDVIGNNIANVNTVGYKAGQVTFKDIFYQSKGRASGGDVISGGVNPKQIGYGGAIATVNQVMTQSGFTFSDNVYDCALQGEGFFQVMDPSGNIFYTRAGSFNVDNVGNLVDPNGYIVLGVAGDATGQLPGSNRISINVPPVDNSTAEVTKTFDEMDVTFSAANYGPDGNISVTISQGDAPYAVLAGNSLLITLDLTQKFASPQDFEEKVNAAVRAGGVNLSDNVLPLEISMPELSDLYTNDYTLYQERTEAKNAWNILEVDLTPNIPKGSAGDNIMGLAFVAVKGGAAANRYEIDLKVGSSLQAKWTDNVLTITVPGGTGTMPTIEAIQEAVIKAANGRTDKLFAVRDMADITTDAEFPPTTGDFGSASLSAAIDDATELWYDGVNNSLWEYNDGTGAVVSTFNQSFGGLDISAGTAATDKTGVGVTTWEAFFGSTIRRLGVANGEDNWYNRMSQSLNTVKLENGRYAAAQSVDDLDTVFIDNDGIIYGEHPVHGRMILGRIDVATFENPMGLEQAGNSYFKATLASGDPQVKQASMDGAGEVVSNATEMSNVDLAQEYSDMIITQRGFQANSRIITVSDTMIEELVNLKR